MIESLLNEAEFVSASKGGKEWTCCWWQASVTGLQARVLSADSQKSNTEWVPYGFSDYSWITSLRFDSHWFPVALTFCLSSTVEVCTLSKMLFKRHTHAQDGEWEQLLKLWISPLSRFLFPPEYKIVLFAHTLFFSNLVLYINEVISNDTKTEVYTFSSFVKFSPWSWKMHLLSTMEYEYSGAVTSKRKWDLPVWLLLCSHDVSLHNRPLRTPDRSTKSGTSLPTSNYQKEKLRKLYFQLHHKE